jgi:hypothetical protein
VEEEKNNTRVAQKSILNFYQLSNSNFVMREVCSAWLKSLLHEDPARRACDYHVAINIVTVTEMADKERSSSKLRVKTVLFLWKQNKV